MIEIVKEEEKHVTAIGKLWWEFIMFHQNIDHIFTPLDGSILGFEENQVRRLMKSPDGLVLVELDWTKVVGYSLAEVRIPNQGFRREKYGYIDDTAVTASHRRKGIGQMMLDEITKLFQFKKIRRVELGIAAKNHVACSFWQKQGFEVYMQTLYKEIK